MINFSDECAYSNQSPQEELFGQEINKLRYYYRGRAEFDSDSLIDAYAKSIVVLALNTPDDLPTGAYSIFDQIFDRQT